MNAAGFGAAGGRCCKLDSGAGWVLLTARAAALAGAAPAGTTGEDVRRSVRVGKLNLVDLAGSERVHITGATGKENQWRLTHSAHAFVTCTLTVVKG